MKVGAIEANVNGRVRHVLPSDANDSWVDNRGFRHPVPQTPANIDRGKLLWDVQASSRRAFVTAHRWVAEANFGRDFGVKMIGSKEEVPQQLLEPFGKPPTPQVSKFFVLNAINHQLAYDFATPLTEKYSLPPNVSYADIGRQLAARVDLPNWLDPLRTGFPSPFLRPNLFAKPTQAELQQGLLIPGNSLIFAAKAK